MAYTSDRASQAASGRVSSGATKDAWVPRRSRSSSLSSGIRGGSRCGSPTSGYCSTRAASGSAGPSPLGSRTASSDRPPCTSPAACSDAMLRAIRRPSAPATRGDIAPDRASTLPSDSPATCSQTMNRVVSACSIDHVRERTGSVAAMAAEARRAIPGQMAGSSQRRDPSSTMLKTRPEGSCRAVKRGTLPGCSWRSSSRYSPTNQGPRDPARSRFACHRVSSPRPTSQLATAAASAPCASLRCACSRWIEERTAGPTRRLCPSAFQNSTTVGCGILVMTRLRGGGRTTRHRPRPRIRGKNRSV